MKHNEPVLLELRKQRETSIWLPSAQKNDGQERIIQTNMEDLRLQKPKLHNCLPMSFFLRTEWRLKNPCLGRFPLAAVWTRSPCGQKHQGWYV